MLKHSIFMFSSSDITYNILKAKEKYFIVDESSMSSQNIYGNETVVTSLCKMSFHFDFPRSVFIKDSLC